MKKFLLFLSLIPLLQQTTTTVLAMKDQNNTGITVVAEKSVGLQLSKRDARKIQKIVKNLLFYLHIDGPFILTPEEEKCTSLNELHDGPDSFCDWLISLLSPYNPPSAGKMLYKLSKDPAIENFLVYEMKKKYLKKRPDFASLNFTAMQLALVVGLLDVKHEIDIDMGNIVYLHPDWLKVFNELPSSIQNYFEDIIGNFQVTLYWYF